MFLDPELDTTLLYFELTLDSDYSKGWGHGLIWKLGFLIHIIIQIYSKIYIELDWQQQKRQTKEYEHKLCFIANSQP